MSQLSLLPVVDLPLPVHQVLYLGKFDKTMLVWPKVKAVVFKTTRNRDAARALIYLKENGIDHHYLKARKTGKWFISVPLSVA